MLNALVDKIKFQSICHPLVNMASVGDITIFDNKTTIAYPYVNVDVVNCLRKNFLKTYTLRIYVCDRNEPYIAYNKTELILTEILEQLNIFDLNIQYFNNDFQDVVNGVYVDVQFQIPIGCDVDAIFDYSLFTDTFIILENGDYLATQNDNYTITEK